MTTDTNTTNTPTDTADPADVTDVVDTYVAAWNETDETRRSALIDRALGEDLWYRDPLLEADGREAFGATLAFVQQHYPGHVLTRTSAVDAHHDLVRFEWALGVPGEEPVLSGVDVAKLDAQGKLHRIIGFVPPSIP